MESDGDNFGVFSCGENDGENDGENTGEITVRDYRENTVKYGDDGKRSVKLQ